MFDTDVAAAAIAEHRWGAGRDVSALCYLTVGTGIGGSLLLDGRPWHGLMHPEIGHLRIPHDRSQDPFDGSCPLHGDCWEGLASGPAIANRWSAPPEDLPDDHPAWVLEAEYMALGILSIVMIAAPQRLILGGGVMDGASLLAPIGSRLRELIAGYVAAPSLVAPALGDRAGVLGAIALAQAAR